MLLYQCNQKKPIGGQKMKNTNYEQNLQNVKTLLSYDNRTTDYAKKNYSIYCQKTQKEDFSMKISRAQNM